MKLIALLLVAPIVLAAATSTRIVRYDGMKAVIQRKDRVEHIVVTDRAGNVQTETTCDWQSGRFDQIVALGRALIATAKRDDRSRMAALMSYPLRLNSHTLVGEKMNVRTVYVQNERALLRRYRAVFTPHVISLLLQDEPRDVFCRNGMSWVAGGLMWATTDSHGVLKVAVINQ